MERDRARNKPSSSSSAKNVMDERRRAGDNRSFGEASGTTNPNSGVDGQATKKKPQPVPEEAKDERYWERRKKNREATKKFRQREKAKADEVVSKYEDIEKTIAELEKRNMKLEKKIDRRDERNRLLEERLSKIAAISSGFLKY